MSRHNRKTSVSVCSLGVEKETEQQALVELRLKGYISTMRQQSSWVIAQLRRQR